MAKVSNSNYDYLINGNKIIKVNTFPPIIGSKYSLGVNMMFRVDKKELICSITCFDEIIQDPISFMECVSKAQESLFDMAIKKPAIIV